MGLDCIKTDLTEIAFEHVDSSGSGDSEAG